MTATIALFGTSADPPTVGHRAVLEGLTGLYPLVATWASDNPFKEHGAPLDLRAALLEAVVRDLQRQVGPQRLELCQDLSSRRVRDSLERAARRFPDHDRLLVVGSDLLEQIPRWAAVEAWLPGCRLGVIARQGWPVQPAALERLQQLGARPELLPLHIPAAASSSIRRHPDPQLVPPELLPRLMAQNLYGFSADGCPPPCGSR